MDRAGPDDDHKAVVGALCVCVCVCVRVCVSSRVVCERVRDTGRGRRLWHERDVVGVSRGEWR